MIDTIDYLTYRIYGWDDSFLYGIRSGGVDTQLFRLTNKEDRPTSPVFTFVGSVRGVWASRTTPGLVFVQSSPGNGKRELHKSINYGVSFGNNSPSFNNGTAVLLLGDTDGTGTNQISDVMLLGRGLAIDNNKVYVAEYNINVARTSGGLNDQVCIRQSSDWGTTWSIVAKWNTNGSHHVRHAHSIQVHDGYVYTAFGDSGTESGILRWDGVSALASNQALDLYPNCFTGAQRYRTGDILFPPGDHMYYMSDTDIGDTERGVWKARKDMTTAPVRVSSLVTETPNHSGWYGVVLPSGRMVFTEFIESTASSRMLKFYGSADGDTWQNIGSYAMQATRAGGADSFFVRGSEVFYAKGGGAGKSSDNDTVVFSESESIVANRVLHPVYWISKSGEDSDTDYRGYSPARPFKTVEHALVSNRITYGARVIVGDGNYNIPPVTLEFSANSSPPTNTDPVHIEPEGTNTVFYGSHPLFQSVGDMSVVYSGIQTTGGAAPSIADSTSGPAILRIVNV